MRLNTAREGEEGALNEFRSELENLVEAEELKFSPTPGFGVYRKFLEHAISHPAKMNQWLLKFLVEEFTKPGEVILDPMAGSGSTGVVAALHGRNCVQVDIEEKFVAWAEEAREKVERQGTLTKKGWIRNIQGDARRLSELLREQTDIIVTSPPYSQTVVGVSEKEFQKKKAIINRLRHERGEIKGGTGESGKLGISLLNPDMYSKNKENIANLPHGSIDTVITSPPYSGSVPAEDEKWLEEHWDDESKSPKHKTMRFGKSMKGYPQKVDAVITSPPYGEAQEGRGIAKEGYKGPKHTPTDLVGERSYMPDKFESEENISRLPYVDTVITSPPYERSMRGSESADTLAVKLEKNWGGVWGARDRHTEGRMRSLESLTGFKESGRKNIGNLKNETYLSAMLKCYEEMYKVLKPGGLAIIVIKPFIRAKKVVDLPMHTWLLLEKAGFKLYRVFKLRLRTLSFWRILYRRRYPEVEKINHEYVLIVEKRGCAE